MPLYRRLDNDHTLIIRRFYPSRNNASKRYRHQVLLGVGGNIGDVGRRLERLWVFLSRDPQITLIQSGVVLNNPPFGYSEQKAFENTVISIGSSLPPRTLLRHLWRIEKRFGRKRSFPNAPRTLDLDMIFFDKRIVKYPELTVPHPEWKKRISVVLPWRSLNYNASTRRRRYENLDV